MVGYGHALSGAISRVHRYEVRRLFQDCLVGLTQRPKG